MFCLEIFFSSYLQEVTEKKNVFHYIVLYKKWIIDETSTMVGAVDFDLPVSPGVSFNNVDSKQTGVEITKFLFGKYVGTRRSAVNSDPTN